MEKMTLFYSKNTGEIKSFTSGVTDMEYFGEDEIDMSIIYDFVVLDLDNYVLDNSNQFKIEDGELVLKQEINLSKYKQEGDE